MKSGYESITPIIIDNDKQVTLKRIFIEKNEDRNEDWMQEKLFDNPYLIPFEDLDENKTEEIIQTLLADKLPKSGSAKNRKNTAPEKGKTTLLEVKNA